MLRPSVAVLGEVACRAYDVAALCRRGTSPPALPPAEPLEDSSLPANARLARLADNPFARLSERMLSVL